MQIIVKTKMEVISSDYFYLQYLRNAPVFGTAVGRSSLRHAPAHLAWRLAQFSLIVKLYSIITF